MRGLFGAIAAPPVARNTSAHPASWFVDWVRGGEATVSGQHVTAESALRTSAVWACVRVRSEDVGKLPCFLYRRLPNGGKERAVNHPHYRLVREQPNPRMTAFEFKQLMQAQIDLRGNAYALKQFDNRGTVVALWPVDPAKVTVLITPDGQDLFYQIAGFPDPAPAESMLHLRGPSLDGVIGLSPISYHRETIGLAIAAQKYGAAFFGNSAQPVGGLKVPHVLQPGAADALRSSWEQRFKGAENAKKLALFDGGMEWVQTGMDNTDAQYLETRNFQNREIWRMYRMPAHKVGDLEKSTNNNIEQQALEYVTDCLMTELVRWEQTLSMSLLRSDERKDYFFEFLPDALLRGDLKSRYEAYAIGRNWGWLSVNDILERENLNHVKNGDIRLQPLNMAEAGAPKLAAPTTPGDAPISAGGAKALLKLAMELVAREEAEAELPPFLKPHANGHLNGNGSEKPQT